MEHLFTDDNPETTLGGLGFKTPQKTMESIQKIEEYFNHLEQEQSIGNWTPPNVRPREFIDSIAKRHQYYRKQKMYRVLGLLNRAKVIYARSGGDNILASIQILEEWMRLYKMYKKI